MNKLEKNYDLHIWFRGARKPYIFETANEWEVKHNNLYIKFRPRQVGDKLVIHKAVFDMGEIVAVRSVKREYQYEHFKHKSYGRSS